MKIDMKKRILIALAVVLAVVLVVLVIVALMGMDDKKPTSTPGNTTAPTQSGNPPADVVINTPYGNILFPGEWADYLEVERTDEPNLQLEFIAQMKSGKRQQLFALTFGEPKDPAVGQIGTADGVAVGVHVTNYEFAPDGTWQVKETTTVSAMQNALKDVLESLRISPLGTPMPEVQGDEIVIETPYAKLYLPGKWIEELQIKVDESNGYDVTFYGVINGHDPIALFAINLGGKQGEIVHTLFDENDVAIPVGVRTFELKMAGWSTVDQMTAVAMVEDMNYLLAKLMGN